MLQIAAASAQKLVHANGFVYVAEAGQGLLIVRYLDFEARDFVFNLAAALLHMAQLDRVQAAIRGRLRRRLGWQPDGRRSGGCGRRLSLRFGRGRLVDHLLGKNKDPTGFEETLSTFGVGGEFDQAGWRRLIDQLLFEGLLADAPNDGRPLIQLGDVEAVRSVYRGERKLSMLSVPASATGATAPRRRRRGAAEAEAPVAAGDAALLEDLRAWRRAEAARQRVPPYVIFHDRTLSDLARVRPSARERLADIGGIGLTKLDRYGPALLRLIADHA